MKYEARHVTYPQPRGESVQEPRISWLSPEKEYSYYTIKGLLNMVYKNIYEILCLTVYAYI